MGLKKFGTYYLYKDYSSCVSSHLGLARGQINSPINVGSLKEATEKRRCTNSC